MSDSDAVTADNYAHDAELWGHPKGLYVCFTTELWERFSFYGMKYLLLLYLTKYHLFSDEAGLDVLGSYAGLVYALPVIGGLIADRYLGMRKSVLFGGTLLAIGHLLMAVEGHKAIFYAAGTKLTESLALASGEILTAGTVLTESITFRDTAALNVFYFALALIVMGVGYLKPNISTIVGKLYAKDDPLRDSGFPIFYMGRRRKPQRKSIRPGQPRVVYLLVEPARAQRYLAARAARTGRLVDAERVPDRIDRRYRSLLDGLPQDREQQYNGVHICRQRNRDRHLRSRCESGFPAR